MDLGAVACYRQMTHYSQCITHTVCIQTLENSQIQERVYSTVE